jgi:hypothetical protein
LAVPAHAVIRDRGNPIGEAVGGTGITAGGIVIGCIVPPDVVLIISR